MITFLDKIRLFFYPFIIFLAAGSLFFAIYLLDFSVVPKFILLPIPIYILTISINLAFTYKSKIRSIYILIKKNKLDLKKNSFQDYMKAPCGRQVVKISLNKINKAYCYNLLKKEFPIEIFNYKKTTTKFVFYKEGEIESIFSVKSD
ncbi:hypothetical protein [Leptospira levettii]|uniref:Uncharacterized protein n=1 Tax=Leptospira levettii TaxID=2023178 RepID=A0AAW5V7P3_9LEPT|nr:hypothetical protein [Leptospira levettii]MCW7467684.1 hypothetical protein [Leptospira levettii]MCW7513410.1 hypothetical protein [Leptospira levettii]MCW7517087.1 hypothetical protein [Leptospira levettii]